MKFVKQLKINSRRRPVAVLNAPFTVKFGLFMALLVSFLLPMALFSPLIVANMLGLPLVEQIGMTAGNFGLYILVSQAIGLSLTLLLIVKKLKKNSMPWSSVGLRGFKVFQGLRYIAGYYLILLGLLVALAVIASGLGAEVPVRPDGKSGGTDALATAGSFWIAFALSVILAPIIEEIVFRGVLFPALGRRYGVVVGIFVSSFLFTLVHINPIQMISVLPLGIYLAIMYYRTGSIYPGMILHATWNLMVLLIAQSSV